MHEQAPNPQPLPTGRRQRVGFQRFSAVELLIAIVLLFVATPFLEAAPGGEFIEAILMSAVLILGVLAIGGRRRMLALATALVLPAVLGKWLSHIRPDLCPRPVFFVAALIFIAFVVVNLLRYVLRAPRVNSEVLCASIAAYLLMGLVWAFAYVLAGQAEPGAFAFSATYPPHQSMDGTLAFYFSFVTLSTVGYGDITPVSSIARMLASTESMTGPLYLAVLIARLVALYSTSAPVTPPPNTDSSLT